VIDVVAANHDLQSLANQDALAHWRKRKKLAASHVITHQLSPVEVLGNVMRRKSARTLRKIVNVRDPEVQSRHHHANDQDHAAVPHQVLREKVEMSAAGVKNAARKEVTGVGVPDMKQKYLHNKEAEDEMVLKEIVSVILLMVLTGKANLLQRGQEKWITSQMMTMSQNWQGMRTMHLKVMQVALRMKTKANCIINAEQLLT